MKAVAHEASCAARSAHSALSYTSTLRLNSEEDNGVCCCQPIATVGAFQHPFVSRDISPSARQSNYRISLRSITAWRGNRGPRRIQQRWGQGAQAHH